MSVSKKIDYIHTVSSSEVASTDSSAFTEVVESSDLVAGKTYHVICNALIEGSHNGSVFEFRLYDTTNGAEVADSKILREVHTANETQSYHFVGSFTAGASGGGLAFQQKAAASKTVRTQSVSMIIMDLSGMRPTDYFLESDSTQAQHTDSYVDRVTKTVDKTKAGDQWMVFAWGSFSMDSTSKTTAMTLSYTNGGSTEAEPETVFEGEDLTEILAFSISRTFTIGTTGTSVWKMQSKDPVLHASTPNDYEAGALFGLRLNAFADFSVDYDTGGTVWIADEFQEAASVSHTPSQAGGNIVLATCIADPDSRGNRGFLARIQVDGTSSPNAVGDTQLNTNTYDATSMPSILVTSTYTGARGVTNTIDLDCKRSVTGDTQLVKDKNLVSFSAELNYDSPTVTGKMRRPGVFRRGGGRTTRKNLRR